MLLHRLYHPDHGIRLGVEIDGIIHDVTLRLSSFASWLISTAGRVPEAIDELKQAASDSKLTYEASTFDHPPEPTKPHLLAPVDLQDVWAAGVTYARSRSARQEEAVDGGDVYERVYHAERPELFYKAHGQQVVPTRGEVGIRHDAAWSVPEPELAVLLNPNMEVVGFTAGNDMSSRDIEGANPLYLPQAKIYRTSCALGSGVLLESRTSWPDTSITMGIQRDGAVIFQGETHTSEITRSLEELIEHLGRCLDFPHGAVLLTGTGIVPPDDFTLQAGDTITIQIAGITRLTNTVKVV